MVHAGHVGIQEPSVQFDIQMVKGFRNILFGGEGLFLATLELIKANKVQAEQAELFGEIWLTLSSCLEAPGSP